MGRYDWYPQASVECISATSTTATLRVKCYFTNDGWNYSMYMSAWIQFDGSWYQVLNRTTIDTTGVSQHGGTVLLGYKDFTVNRQTSDKSWQYAANIMSDGGYSDGDKYTDDGYYKVNALASYTVSYNANGGSGAPAAQTKYHSKSITLSTTKPTRTGYTFLGWATSSTATSATIQPGATYSSNASVTYYAVWKINTWTVSYNANGGSGAPANQTKTYGVNLTLSSTIPTRNLYTFKGWATSEGGSVSYEPGATYASNANLVLYAVWELAYVSPSVLIDTCYRIDSNGNLSDDGSNAQLTFTYNADRSIDDTNNISKATVYCKLKSESNWTTIKAYTPNNQTGTLTCDNFETAMGTVSPDEQYDVKVTVEDTYGKTLTNAPYTATATTYISMAFFTMDFLAGGHGIAFGKPSKNEGFECGMNATFDGNVAVNGDVNCSNNLTVGSDAKDGTVTVNGDVNCSNSVTVNGGGIKCYNNYAKVIRSSGNSCFWAERSDTDKKILFGVGSDGYNRGIWDINASQWTIHRDANNNIFVGDKRIVPMVLENNYWGIKTPDSAEKFIRTTSEGLIPYKSGGNSSSLGTSGWPFKNIYGENVYANGIRLGKHKVLWSGGLYMTANQTATLSEGASSQPNGLVLVFSRYENSTSQNYCWTSFFVPKYVITTHGGCGHYFTSTEMGRPWNKYLYISNSAITGHADNTSNGNFNGIDLYNNYCVLRYVIGV